jgi:ketosteroid isomerase-like protein
MGGAVKPGALTLALVLALAWAIAGCGTQAGTGGVPAPAPADDFTGRQAGFLAAMAARDADRIATYFTEDAVLHVANMPAVRGAEAIGAFHGNVFRFMTSTSASIERYRISEAGDLAYTLGRVANTFGGPDGPVEYEGKFFLAWERRGGEWRVAVYGVSNDRAAPGS